MWCYPDVEFKVQKVILLMFLQEGCPKQMSCSLALPKALFRGR